MTKQRSVLYVNFAPYENVGKVLDFLRQHFDYVFMVSFNHHHLSGRRNTNRLTIYYRRRQLEEHYLYAFPTPQGLVWFFLPLRSLFILVQLLYLAWKLSRKYGQIDLFLTVNAFTAWIGNLARSCDFVKRTVFWVWDYYPPHHPSLLITLMRWFYWQFDKISTNADKVVFLNHRLQQLRQEIGTLDPNLEYPLVAIGTNPHRPPKLKPLTKNLNLGFIGVLKTSQGLDYIYDHAPKLTSHFNSITLHIIGSGPDEHYFKQRAKNSPIKTIFHGLLSEDIPAQETKIADILNQCHLGIALYVPDKSNASYYGDPAKVKKYLSLGLPVITTNVFEFCPEITKAKAGQIIDYFQPNSLTKAILKITKSLPNYRRNAYNLAKKYHYQKLYLPLIKP